MTFGIPGKETKDELETRVRARVEGERFWYAENENIRVVLDFIQADLRGAAKDGAVPDKLRFALLMRGDHLLIDVFGLEDHEINDGDTHTEEAAAIKATVEKIANAYNWSNPVAAWDCRYALSVRLLSEHAQWGLRNAKGMIEVRVYPY